MWYSRTFDVPRNWTSERIWLRFGAVDYACQVWVNDVLVGTHEGGHTPFGFDITSSLRTDANTLVVRAVDSWKDLTVPRGKQTWREEPWGIFYTRTTGIWQTVWLEPLPDAHIVDVYATASGPRARFEIELSASTTVELTVLGRMLNGSGRSVVLEADLDDAPKKVEDPQWLHLCDRAGLLVWSEMANAFAFTAEASRRLAAEWQAAVRRDRSHPCIVAWVPLNESWGVPEIRTDVRQQAFARSLYHLTKALDATRPCVDNDGWEHTDDTDLLTVHDYSVRGDDFDRPWVDGLPTRLHRPPLVDGATYRDQPVLVTEYGGISYNPTESPEGSWGYGDTETTGGSLLDRYRGLVDALARDGRYAGWCYTQLTDVQQETNGLLTFDRRPKVDPATIASINRDLNKP